MGELDCEESWVLKNWCFWTVVLEKTLESPLDCKEIQPAHSTGVQSWVFFGRTDAKAETPVFWPSHAKSWLIGKDSDAGRDWGQEEKGTREDEIGWMASPTRWTWVWVNSGSLWWTGRRGVLLFMGSQRVGHNWVAELNWLSTRILNHFQLNVLGLHTLPVWLLSVSLCSLSFVVQLLNHVQLFGTPWTSAPQASLSFTISLSLLHIIPFCKFIITQTNTRGNFIWGRRNRLALTPQSQHNFV